MIILQRCNLQKTRTEGVMNSVNNALYFPYISIPRTPWLIQALLYWDSVASIAPREFTENLDQLQPHMRQLIADRMVTLISPSEYIWRIEDFEEKFLEIIDSKPRSFWHHSETGPFLPSGMRRERIHSEKFIIPEFRKNQIHADKLSSLISELTKRGLASKGHQNWYYVDEKVANYFMTYLAVGISGLANYRPVSDKYSGLSAFSGDDLKGMPPLRSRLRARVLEEILPTPAVVKDFRDIYRFKEKHGVQLKKFKRRIERFLISVETLSYHEAKELVDDFIQEVREEKEEIVRRMEEGRMSRITFNTVCAVCGAGAGLAGGVAMGNPYAIGVGTFGLASQIWSIYKSNNLNEFSNNPMAYAVYVQRKFTHVPKCL